MSRAVIVAPYDPAWPARFEREARALAPLFAPLGGLIHHMGSTSVPGLAAKPIIDILIEVDDIAAVDGLNEVMTALGYDPRGEYGIAGRRYFSRRRGQDDDCHVHVFERGSLQAARHLALRDYLRAHPAQARRYGELKQALARQHPTDIDAYMDGKDALVKALQHAALEWQADRKTATDFTEQKNE